MSDRNEQALISFYRNELSNADEKIRDLEYTIIGLNEFIDMILFGVTP